MSAPVYLDCNATTPLEPEVRDIMLEWLDRGPHNAGSRTHVFGAEAKRAVERAREVIAEIAFAQPEEVVFTGGATESNNIAILGLAQYGAEVGRRHIVSSAIEHKAVLEPLQALARQGFEVELLQPEEGGWLSAEQVAAALRPETLLVSIMHVNNETGVIQPISEIADRLENHPAFFHVDAAQGFGKRLDELRAPRIDLISATAHKIYGPQGIGVLIARRRGYKRPPLSPLMYGGGQERGLRPGTLPLPLVVGFGRAAELALECCERRSRACTEYRRRVFQHLSVLGPRLHGDPSRMMPHVLNVSFPGVDAEALMVALKDLIAISNGSACTSHSYKPSHVLQAMRLSEEEIAGAIRISWSHRTPYPDWERIVSTIASLRMDVPMSGSTTSTG